MVLGFTCRCGSLERLGSSSAGLMAKRFERGLGPSVDVGLAKAREMAMKTRLQMIDGIDPMTERKAVKAERARLKAEATVARSK